MPTPALNVAKYLLSLPDGESGELISNLKLQKLLYYAQGYHLGLHGVDSPLFPETVYAWKHGPVVQTVYNHFVGAKDGPIKLVERPPRLNDDAQLHLQRIHNMFGKYSAWALRDMTHKESPWLENYKPDVQNIIIPHKDLHRYFSRYVKKA